MYVATRQRRGGLAGRAHRLPRLRGLRGGLRRGGLGQDDAYYDPNTGADVFDPVTLQPVSGDINLAPIAQGGTSVPGLPAGYGVASSSGLTPTEASLISQSLNTTGQLVSKALTPTPTVSYNPSTGLYTATGGAALPSSSSLLGASLTSSLGSYLPLLLLGGAVVLVFSMVKK